MDTIGLDLHKRESQLCIIGSGGEITERRFVTSRERLTAVLGGRARGFECERDSNQTGMAVMIIIIVLAFAVAITTLM